MEILHSDLRDTIGPRLKGKMQQKQRSWMLVSSWRRRDKNQNPNKRHRMLLSPQISDAVYRQVLCHTTGQYRELVEACEARRAPLDARLRTDMDQIVTSKEHVTNKIRGGKRAFPCVLCFHRGPERGEVPRLWQHHKILPIFGPHAGLSTHLQFSYAAQQQNVKGLCTSSKQYSDEWPFMQIVVLNRCSELL